jgi:predicted nucleic acid-binding protein
LTTDLGGALRRRKPEKRLARLAVRPPGELTGAGDLADTGPVALVPDTSVYIRNAAGLLSPAAQALLDRARLFHCSVCLAELAIGVANADPSRPNWADLRGYYVELFAAVPATRLLIPDAQIWAEAGVIAGTLARTQTYQKHQLKECLNDALIYLSAAKAGLPVLTANRDDFDLIQQLAPEGRFVHF